MSGVPQKKSIAISRQQGSGGSYIGRAVAERLGLLYFDREMLRTASEYLSAADDSKGQSKDSWLERLGAVFALGPLDIGYVPPSPTVLYEGELLGIEDRLLREIVDEHPAVIVGRGAAQILKEDPKVLTVFIHAPEAWRVDRVQQVYKTTDRAQAQKMVRQSDQERARYIRRIADGDWADPRCYDLAINSKTLGFDVAVDLIVRSVAGKSVEAPTVKA